MDKAKFSAMLMLIVPQILQLVVQRYGCHEVEASQKFYTSQVYALLEQEETKLWQLSPLTLFHMYDEEQKSGTITFPEG